MIPILAASVLCWWDFTGNALFYKLYVGTSANPNLFSYTVYAPTQSVQIDGLDSKVTYTYVEKAFDSTGKLLSTSNSVSKAPMITP